MAALDTAKKGASGAFWLAKAATVNAPENIRTVGGYAVLGTVVLTIATAAGTGGGAAIIPALVDGGVDATKNLVFLGVDAAPHILDGVVYAGQGIFSGIQTAFSGVDLS